MFRFDAARPLQLDGGFSRRDFLHAGALSAFGLSLPGFLQMKAQGAVRPDKNMNCIMLTLLGGPSQLDTWDMKPQAPVGIRSPFRPIRTNVPGIEISEIFPRLARQMDKVALVHACHHDGAATHEAGLQLLQTGHLFQDDCEPQHIGDVVQKLKGACSGVPAHVMLPYKPCTSDTSLPSDYLAAVRDDPRRNLRARIEDAVRSSEARPDARLYDDNFHQAFTLMSSAAVREAFDLAQEPDVMRDRYGRNRFGQSCLLARRMIERGVRFVTINMFDTVVNEVTWDMHGSAPFSSLACYRDQVGPMFDHGYATLLEDLQQRGLLQNTLIIATGEFGRTPQINPAGGRDHWPECWTMLCAGGGVQGGQKIGASDKMGAAPQDRPVTPAEVAATAYHALGIAPGTTMSNAAGDQTRLVTASVRPISELF